MRILKKQATLFQRLENSAGELNKTFKNDNLFKQRTLNSNLY